MHGSLQISGAPPCFKTNISVYKRRVKGVAEKASYDIFP